MIHRMNELGRESGFCENGGHCEESNSYSSDHLSNSDDSRDTSLCSTVIDPSDSATCNGSSTRSGESSTRSGESSKQNSLFTSATSPVTSHPPDMQDIHVVLYEGPNRVPLSSPHCSIDHALF